MPLSVVNSSQPYERCRLLVSVRSASEARAALAGGADILDVKEPMHGPLGAASMEVITAVAEVVQNHASQSIPLSAALGELRDFHKTPQLPHQCAWVKFGLSGLRDQDWSQPWRAARREIQKCLPDIRLIPVIYADWQTCAAPSPAEVIRVALESDAPGILFDTFDKQGGTLVDYLSLAELSEPIRQIQSAGRFVALAGSLRGSQIADLMELQPEILAVRSAACVGGRQGCVDAQCVAAIKAAMNTASVGARRTS